MEEEVFSVEGEQVTPVSADSLNESIRILRQKSSQFTIFIWCSIFPIMSVTSCNVDLFQSSAPACPVVVYEEARNHCHVFNKHAVCFAACGFAQSGCNRLDCPQSVWDSYCGDALPDGLTIDECAEELCVSLRQITEPGAIDCEERGYEAEPYF